jgi:insulysin
LGVVNWQYTMSTPPAGIERMPDDLDKPLLDDRSYRVIKLSNRLEALLIHDNVTDKASAAMDIAFNNDNTIRPLPTVSELVRVSLVQLRL